MNNLYFIAILPPVQVQQEVTVFKQAARDLFKSGHALKSPPHVTIIPPQRWDEVALDWVVHHLGEWTAQQKPFQVHIDGFDAFTPRVIFLNIEEKASLQSFQQACTEYLSHLLEKLDTRPFHPHMTVAFKDLDRRQFEKAWAYFGDKHYTSSFEVNALYLLNYKSGQWQVMGKWLLGKPNSFIKGQ
ncbi:MAG: 2'-5' RNA ligase family protein [Saprospiraceae bacterium]|nr:2'-5' RNA ligase family protein [Saprospiraceae bacterium]MCB9318878.1 2'-5' RNA ligase family protein [Lewinellaceae bacterium]